MLEYLLFSATRVDRSSPHCFPSNGLLVELPSNLGHFEQYRLVGLGGSTKISESPQCFVALSDFREPAVG